MQPLQFVQSPTSVQPFLFAVSGSQNSKTASSFADHRPVERWLVHVLNHLAASPALDYKECALVAGSAEQFTQGQALQVLSQTSLTIREREVKRCYAMRRQLEKLLEDNRQLFEQTAYGQQRAAEFREVAAEVQRGHDFDILLLERVFAQAQGMVGLFQELCVQAAMARRQQ